MIGWFLVECLLSNSSAFRLANRAVLPTCIMNFLSLLILLWLLNWQSKYIKPFFNVWSLWWLINFVLPCTLHNNWPKGFSPDHTLSVFWYIFSLSIKTCEWLILVQSCPWSNSNVSWPGEKRPFHSCSLGSRQLWMDAIVPETLFTTNFFNFDMHIQMLTS